MRANNGFGGLFPLLALPTPAGWSLIGGGALAAVALSRIFAAGSELVGKAAGERRLPLRQSPRLAFEVGTKSFSRET